MKSCIEVGVFGIAAMAEMEPKITGEAERRPRSSRILQCFRNGMQEIRAFLTEWWSGMSRNFNDLHRGILQADIRIKTGRSSAINERLIMNQDDQTRIRHHARHHSFPGNHPDARLANRPSEQDGDAHGEHKDTCRAGEHQERKPVETNDPEFPVI